MSKITNIITSQGYEIIRDRIATILADEIDNQAVMTYDPYLESLDVKVEAKNPNDISELPLVNVSIANVDYANKNQGSVDGTITINVDAYTSAPSENGNDGAKIATLYLHRILGICRYVLEDPIYKTLGFLQPQIMRTLVSNITFKDIDNNDANNVAMGRLTFTVVANEPNKLIVPQLIAGYQTTINLDNTSNGYFYESV